MDIAPVSPAIQDPHENACSGQANERTALPEDSAGAVQSAANVPRNDSQDKVEVYLTDHELLNLSEFLIFYYFLFASPLVHFCLQLGITS